ncbi:ATP-binding cassette domain-containing protein [Cognatishimia sp. SS12]|uniref:ABC transporter ATP-binding protein n=1 Tax=Cognatishimia sp. SS12 TaxID=2979465 RepID=UPI002330748C|nr:ATP-binding cassette domain-containing protein [Cognatishimia sp. SS12]MDC0738438.1 ATP-binding cassette domain-containing protein [Cognatishimia sp. SS12]
MSTAPSLFLRGRAAIDGTPVFGALDLQVPAGRWTCLLGSSGVGKSTVLKLFAGLADHVDFVGEIGAADSDDLAGRVAMMAQSDLLLPWLSVAQNVALGAKLRGEASDAAKVSDVLARVGLAEKAQSMPDALSGGQRQRAALARTLMEDRPIVLLDEPFSALDAKNRARMQELTAEVLAGRTVLLITHEPAEAARLGHFIKIMTDQGIEDVPAPIGDVPRAVDAPDVLEIQARLLAKLREDA